MSDRIYRQMLFFVALLFALGSPVSVKAAEQPRPFVAILPSPATVVLADGWSVGKLVYGGGRTRIVQICAVVMSIALFIMMRKLN